MVFLTNRKKGKEIVKLNQFAYTGKGNIGSYWLNLVQKEPGQLSLLSQKADAVCARHASNNISFIIFVADTLPIILCWIICCEQPGKLGKHPLQGNIPLITIWGKWGKNLQNFHLSQFFIETAKFLIIKVNFFVNNIYMTKGEFPWGKVPW